MPQTLTCSRSMEMPVVAETNKPFLVPFNRNPHFVGRVEDLHDLHTALQADEAVGIIPAGITGMGGIGKTQLAVEYVYQHRADSDGSRAISASDDRTLKVWNLETGEELISISLDGSLYCLVLGKDGCTIVTGDGAGNVYCLRYVERG